MNEIEEDEEEDEDEGDEPGEKTEWNEKEGRWITWVKKDQVEILEGEVKKQRKRFWMFIGWLWAIALLIILITEKHYFLAVFFAAVFWFLLHG